MPLAQARRRTIEVNREMKMATSMTHPQLAPETTKQRLKILVPIDATERSRWGILYARRCGQSGRNVEVTLLHVAEPIVAWQVRRFFSEEEVRSFQAQRANYLLQDAAEALRQAGIPVTMKFQEGDIAFEILDIAEQFDCDEIALPLPHARWTRLLTPDIVRKVQRLQRDVPVTTVDASGTPVGGGMSGRSCAVTDTRWS